MLAACGCGCGGMQSLRKKPTKQQQTNEQHNTGGHYHGPFGNLRSNSWESKRLSKKENSRQKVQQKSTSAKKPDNDKS